VNGVEDHGIFEEFSAAEGTSPSLFAVRRGAKFFTIPSASREQRFAFERAAPHCALRNRMNDVCALRKSTNATIRHPAKTSDLVNCAVIVYA
jgi:hypothetical protein